MARTNLNVFAVAGLFIIGFTLWAWGQPFICTCGEIKLWVPTIFDGGNSQHIADWYTLSHILHGVLIALLGRLFFKGLGFNALFLTAIVTGIGWEVIEHTNWVSTIQLIAPVEAINDWQQELNPNREGTQ